MKAWQDWLYRFDTQMQQTRKDCIERQRRRWEALCGNQFLNQNRQKLSLGHLPASLDRVPNPFGSLGADPLTWSWLHADFAAFAKEQVRAIMLIAKDLFG
jgi:hypothetical protein